MFCVCVCVIIQLEFIRFFPVFGEMKSEFTIQFNTYTKKRSEAKKENEDEGPVVERLCSKCGNDKMSYATLQLRSADEGQTVFYTCTKCKYVQNHNNSLDAIIITSFVV